MGIVLVFECGNSKLNYAGAYAPVSFIFTGQQGLTDLDNCNVNVINYRIFLIVFVSSYFVYSLSFKEGDMERICHFSM